MPYYILLSLNVRQSGVDEKWREVIDLTHVCMSLLDLLLHIKKIRV